MEGLGAKGLKTKLIVNYLPQSMSDDQFRALFSQVGPLESHRVMRDKASDYSFGYGFIDYTDPNHALEAIAKLNGHRIDNKTLRVAFSKPPGSNKNVNLYVSGLGLDISEDRLLMLFSNHGDVINTKVLREKDGSSKGAGFVLFKTKTEADAAIRALQGYVDGNGSNFQIKYAKDSSEQQRSHPRYQEFIQNKFQGQAIHHPQQQQQQQQPVATYQNPYSALGYGYMAMGQGQDTYAATAYGGGYATIPYGSTDLSGGQKAVRGRGNYVRYNPIARPVSSNSIGDMSQMLPGDATCLFVYNIGQEATDGDLYGLFAKFGRISKVDIVVGKGFGFVHMPIPAEAQDAITKLNGMVYNGKMLQVSIKNKK